MSTPTRLSEPHRRQRPVPDLPELRGRGEIFIKGLARLVRQPGGPAFVLSDRNERELPALVSVDEVPEGSAYFLWVQEQFLAYDLDEPEHEEALRLALGWLRLVGLDPYPQRSGRVDHFHLWGQELDPNMTCISADADADKSAVVGIGKNDENSRGEPYEITDEMKAALASARAALDGRR